MRQKIYAYTDQDGCDPAAAVDILFQKEFGGNRVRHQRE
jgi:hypothetical protein